MNADSLSPDTSSIDTAETIVTGEIENVTLMQAGNDTLDVTVPAGENVVRVPVIAGATIRLPFDEEAIGARFDDANGNLAIRSGDTTIILQGYAEATAAQDVTILDEDGSPIDVAATIAATDPDLDIQTAAGPAAGDAGTGADNTGGVFEPFDPLDGIGGLAGIGGLGATALSYTVVEVAIEQPVPPDEVTAAAEVIPPEEPDTLSPINYNDANSGTENVYRDTNVMVVLDLSGSMKEDANDDLAGVQSRMSIAQAVLANLLLTYETLGDVRTTIVVFNEGATTHFTWGSVADAIASLGTLTPQDRTNYQAALEEAQNAWANGGKLDNADNVIYFLSDGKPTVGGGSGNHLTDAQKDAWNDFLEDPANGIDHLYVVGIGDDVDQMDDDLGDVANPDGNGLPPGEVILVDDPADDLGEQLIGTIEGEQISGNVLSGVDTSGDGDTGTPGDADVGGDGTTHIHTFSYDGGAGFAVEFEWNGTSDSLTQIGVGGQNVSFNDLEVSFDTEYGRMTFDFANGNYVFTPGSVSANTDVTFHYGTRDSDGDVDEPGGDDGDGAAGGGDLVITIEDTPDTQPPALAAFEADAAVPPPSPVMPTDAELATAG